MRLKRFSQIDITEEESLSNTIRRKKKRGNNSSH